MDEETQNVQDMTEELSELRTIVDDIHDQLQRALSLASEITENTDRELLSSIEVAQFGIKAATRRLPEAS